MQIDLASALTEANNLVEGYNNDQQLLYTRYTALDSVDAHFRTVAMDYSSRLSSTYNHLDKLQVPSTGKEVDSPFELDHSQTISDFLDAAAFTSTIQSIYQLQQSISQCKHSSNNVSRCLSIVINDSPSIPIHNLMDDFASLQDWLTSYSTSIQPTINAHLVSVDIHWNQLISADSDGSLTAQDISILTNDVEELALIVNECEGTLGEAESTLARSDDLKRQYSESLSSIEERLELLRGVEDTVSQCDQLQTDIEAYVEQLTHKLGETLSNADELLDQYEGYMHASESLYSERSRQLSVAKEIERIRDEADMHIRQLQLFNQTKEEEFWTKRSSALPQKLVQAFRGV